MNIVNKKFLSTIIVALFALSILTSVVPVSAKTQKIDVYEGQSIQAAIDAVSAGGKVIVHAGTYNEKVIVEKQLTLLGEDAVLDLTGIAIPVVQDGWGNAGIFVAAGGVTVSGFTIKNVPYYPNPVNPSALPFAFGIRFFGSFAGGVVENNEIISDYNGIGITGAFLTSGISDVVVRNNKVSATTAIWGFNAPDLTIKDDVLTATINHGYSVQPVGVTIGGSIAYSDVKINGNEINSDAIGISLNGQLGNEISDVEVKNNVIHSNDGIRTTIGNLNTVIKNNEINAANNGIVINGINAVVKNNIISNPANGIVLNGASNTEVSKNNVQATSLGIQVFGGSNVQIKDNSVISYKSPIWIADAPDFVVKNNVVTAKASAADKYADGIDVTSISIGGFSGGLIEKNTITADYRGVFVVGHSADQCPSNIEIRKNTIHKSINGIEANYAPGVIIQSNLVYETNVDPDMLLGFGIILGFPYSGGLVKDNEVYAVQTGIQLGGPGGPTNIEIIGNTVYSAKQGINQGAGSDATIKNNVVFAGPVLGAVGIVTNGANPIINGNFVNSTGVGINVINGNNAVVKNNEVNATGTGISVGSSTLIAQTSEISDNIIYNSGMGLVLVRLSEAVVKHNVVNASIFGIGLSGINNQVSHNTITGNFNNGINIRFQQNGATITESEGNVLTKNTIVGGNKPGDIGIYLYPSTSANTVSRNDISNVDFPIVDDGTNIIIP